MTVLPLLPPGSEGHCMAMTGHKACRSHQPPLDSNLGMDLSLPLTGSSLAPSHCPGPQHWASAGLCLLLCACEVPSPRVARWLSRGRAARLNPERSQ